MARHVQYIRTYNIHVHQTLLSEHRMQSIDSTWPCTCIGIEYIPPINNVHKIDINPFDATEIKLSQLTECEVRGKTHTLLLNKILSIIASKWIMLALTNSFKIANYCLHLKLFLNRTTKKKTIQSHNLHFDLIWCQLLFFLKEKMFANCDLIKITSSLNSLQC